MIHEPPYEVSESGYAGFLLSIEVYFKNKHTYRKIKFEYDLFLNGDGAPPVTTSRLEKLKFRNPAEDFRQKLLKAGAVSLLFIAYLTGGWLRCWLCALACLLICYVVVVEPVCLVGLGLSVVPPRWPCG